MQPDTLDLPAYLRKPRLRRAEASEYLRLAHGIECSVRTLAKLACTGGGPAYQSFRRTPLYPRDTLDAWAAKELGPVKSSTSSKGEAA